MRPAQKAVVSFTKALYEGTKLIFVWVFLSVDFCEEEVLCIASAGQDVSLESFLNVSHLLLLFLSFYILVCFLVFILFCLVYIYILLLLSFYHSSLCSCFFIVLSLCLSLFSDSFSLSLFVYLCLFYFV